MFSKFFLFLILIQELRSEEVRNGYLIINRQIRQISPNRPALQSLTRRELCGKERFTELKVSSAFKVGKYVGIVGTFSGQLGTIEAAIRVTLYSNSSEKSGQPHQYIDVKPWKDIKEINDKNKINFAFNAYNMKPLFKNQKSSELVFVVMEKNRTEAIQFDLKKFETSKDEITIDPEFEIFKVFTPNGLDVSGYLGLKFLFLHFPPELRILSILIFDKPNTKEDVITNFKHFALVYTEEDFQGKKIYMRYHLRSEIQTYVDNKGVDFNFYRLYWYFDENVNYCEEMTPKAPDALLFLGRDQTMVSIPGHPGSPRSVIHFAEFYGLNHNLKKITFESSDDTYGVEDDGPDQQIDNAKSLLNCKPELETLCGKKRFTEFKVTAAFNLGKYIGIVGKLVGESGIIEEAAIRVTHYSIPDEKGESPYLYFDVKPWNDIKAINDENKITFAFSADNMKPLFKNQKSSELVFVVMEKNRTEAIQFNLTKLEASKDEFTIDPEVDILPVYAPEDDLDLSGYLGLKFLFMHFPPELRILSILVFDKPDIDEDFNPFIRHMAVVYTEEDFKGKKIYMRHFLRSEIHTFVDQRTVDLNSYRLYWHFDESVNYCEQIKPKAPDAVVFLRKEETMVGIPLYPMRYTPQTVIYFAEFYGLNHKLKKITFDISGDTYRVEDDGKDKQIDNAKSFLNCRKHSAFESLTEPPPIPCGDYHDQTNNAKEPGAPFFEVESKDRQKQISTFSTIAIIIITLIILALLVVSIYLTLKSDK